MEASVIDKESGDNGDNPAPAGDPPARPYGRKLQLSGESFVVRS
jgi:hypothetical protein